MARRKQNSKRIQIPDSEGPSRKRLIQDADTWASRYIRLVYIGDDNLVKCYTCGAKFSPEKIQNGHFVGRGYYSTRYDIMNMHPQCMKCNKFRSGEPGKYALKLIKDYGVDRFISLLEKGSNQIVLSAKELTHIRDSFKSETNKLLKEVDYAAWW